MDDNGRGDNGMDDNCRGDIGRDAGDDGGAGGAGGAGGNDDAGDDIGGADGNDICDTDARVLFLSLLLTIGKVCTSLIEQLLVINITKRSIPIPNPAVGGSPYLRASTKTSFVD